MTDLKRLIEAMDRGDCQEIAEIMGIGGNMSCMEHTCLACGWMEFNNSRGPSLCPKCCGDMRHEWDERNDNRDESDYGNVDTEEL